jgi:hypothetical protein
MKQPRTTDENMYLDRLHDRFIELCWQWMGSNRANKTGLANQVGLPYPRISELLGKKKRLTMYYTRRFIKRGVFMVDDIYDGKPESAEEAEQWDILRIQEDMPLQKKITLSLKGTLTRERLMAILDSHINETKSE